MNEMIWIGFGVMSVALIAWMLFMMTFKPEDWDILVKREEERKAEQLPYAQLAVPAAYLGLAGAQMNLRDKLFGGGAPERIAGADFARQVEAGGARDMQRQQLEEARAGNEYLRSLVDLERARKNLAVLSR